MTTSTQTQLRRGTSAQVAAMTPAQGEVVFDTTNKRLSAGDASTAGGIPHVNAADAQDQAFTYASAGGTANALTITLSPALSAYAAGVKVKFKATAGNSGAVTLNVNGLGAKNLYKVSGGVLTALASGDVINGGIYEATYDGTQFQLTNTAGAAAAGSAYQNSPANPASVGNKMLGLAGSITPGRSGNILIIFTGTVNYDGVDTITHQIRYGTGSAPAHGATLTGTTAGPVATLSISTSSTPSYSSPVTLAAVVTGLTVGTAYWVDMAQNASSGAPTLTGIGISIIEI